jgi:hypothetical protein
MLRNLTKTPTLALTAHSVDLWELLSLSAVLLLVGGCILYFRRKEQ